MPEWINEIHELFPQKTIERIEKDALERYNGASGNVTSLIIMIESYEGLGMTALAADARRVMDNSFGDGEQRMALEGGITR